MSTEPTLLCPTCHNKVTANDTFCGSCGHQLKAGEAVPAPASVEQTPPAVPVAQTPPPVPVAPPVPTAPAVSGPVVEAGDGKKNKLAVVSLVLAISALILGIGIFIFPLFGIVIIAMYITSIVLGIMSLKSQKRGLAIAGIIMSSILVVITTGFLILYSVGMSVCTNPEKYDITAAEVEEQCKGSSDSAASRVPSMFKLIWNR